MPKPQLQFDGESDAQIVNGSHELCPGSRETRTQWDRPMPAQWRAIALGPTQALLLFRGILVAHVQPLSHLLGIEFIAVFTANIQIWDLHFVLETTHLCCPRCFSRLSPNHSPSQILDMKS